MTAEERNQSEGQEEMRPILMSKQELDALSSMDPADKEAHEAAMATYGIKADSGFVKIKAEGEIVWITTDSNDFGTHLDEDTVAEHGLK